MAQFIYIPNSAASSAGIVEIVVWRNGEKFGVIKERNGEFFCIYHTGAQSPVFPTIKDVKLHLEAAEQ